MALSRCEPLARRARRGRGGPVDSGEVCGEGGAGDALPAVVRLDALARRGAEAATQRTIAEQQLDRAAQRVDVPGLDEQAGATVLDQVREAADGGGDDGLPVRHRLGADNAEAFGERGADD